MRAPLEVTPGYSLNPRLRVFAGKDMILGSGKIMLLRLIQETGSIAEAARTMEMSYNHAWVLIRTMNDYFNEPLVEAARGGRGTGGAKITQTGEKVLSLYNEMIEECLKVTRPQWKSLKGLLKNPDAAGE